MLAPAFSWRPLSASDSPDCLDLSGLRPAPTLPIPDARSIVANPSLRFVDLNREINRSYATFGQLMQEIVDPGFEGASAAYPTWYGMGVFASRTAGRSMQAAEQALAVIKGARVNAEVEAKVNPLGLWGDVKLCARFLTAFFEAQQEPATRGSAWFDPRTVTVAAHRMARALMADDGPPVERIERVVQTLLNTLEDGNRRIFSDIGVAGQAFLEARRDQGGPLSDEQLVSMAPRPEEARQVLGAAREAIEQGQPMPVCADSANMLWAAFALYEEAGRSPAGRRDPCIRMANDMMAYHEQFTVVAPAFKPSAPIPGEADRYFLFGAVTPSVAVNTRAGTWRYSRYAAEHLPPRDHNPLTPRVTEYNWAEFGDRWPAIMDFFGRCYREPERLWPMPPAEPSAPL